MSWQTLTAIVLGVLIFGTVCFLLGRASKQPEPPKEIKSIEWKHDTTTVEIPSKPITIKDTTGNATRTKTTVTSSTSGTEQGVGYTAKVTISQLDKDLEKYPSDWEIIILPPAGKIITVRDTLTIDNTRQEIVTKYLKPPFFLQEFFWVSIIELAIVFVAIIF